MAPFSQIIVFTDRFIINSVLQQFGLLVIKLPTQCRSGNIDAVNESSVNKNEVADLVSFVLQRCFI